MPPEWVKCPMGQGQQLEGGVADHRVRAFPKHSVGQVREIHGDHAEVWLIGTGETWLISISELLSVNVEETGDKFEEKICNVCHRLLPVDEFARNQNNKHGIVRRPSCRRCRTDIDKRAPKSNQARRMERKRPKKGDPFRCPICRKRSIANVTAKIVADHDHHTGNIRDFICDSCNTGLGRFKNGADYLQNALHYLHERETLA